MSQMWMVVCQWNQHAKDMGLLLSWTTNNSFNMSSSFNVRYGLFSKKKCKIWPIAYII